MSADPNQAAVGGLVLLWAFGGVVRTYRTIVNSLGRFGMLLHFMSPFKWSLELQVRATSLLLIATLNAPRSGYLGDAHLRHALVAHQQDIRRLQLRPVSPPHQ